MNHNQYATKSDFFSLRNILFSYLLLIIRIVVLIALMYTVPGFTTRQYNINSLDALDDFATGILISILTFKLIAEAILSSNIILFDGCKIVLVQNAILVTISTSLTAKNHTLLQLFLSYSIPISIILEYLYLIFLTRVYSVQINRAILINIGLSPDAFYAYLTRKKALNFSKITIQWTLVLFLKLVLPPFIQLDFGFISISFYILGCLAYLMTEINTLNEFKTAKLVNIIINICKIGFNLAIIVEYFISGRKKYPVSKDININVYIDVLVLSLITLYHLIYDYRSTGFNLNKINVTKIPMTIE
jgi:hypothetical protein